MSTTDGYCKLCDKVTSKTAMKNHIHKDHNSGDEKCYLIKAEGAYAKKYWLFFSVPTDAKLSDIDKFLRSIWCECCDHMSGFSIQRHEIEMSQKLSTFSKGDMLLYEYDYGSTTEIIITIIDKISRVKHDEKVQLLARNVMTEYLCDKCGAPATMIDPMDDYARLCDECATVAEEEEGDSILPLTNSPRCGVCGYTGEHDYW